MSLAHGNPTHLLLAGRSEHKVRPVLQEINKINPSIKVTFIQIDLGSQGSVRHAAVDINNAVEKIDILINNAAIMACPYVKTEDGIESQFATNYIGHFLLTNLLMGKLQAAGGGSRIVNLTSTAGAAGEINFNDINFDVSLICCRMPPASGVNTYFITRTAKVIILLQLMANPKWQIFSSQSASRKNLILVKLLPFQFIQAVRTRFLCARLNA